MYTPYLLILTMFSGAGEIIDPQPHLSLVSREAELVKSKPPSNANGRFTEYCGRSGSAASWDPTRQSRQWPRPGNELTASGRRRTPEEYLTTRQSLSGSVLPVMNWPMATDIQAFRNRSSFFGAISVLLATLFAVCTTRPVCEVNPVG